MHLLWLPRPLYAAHGSAKRLATLGAGCYIEPLLRLCPKQGNVAAALAAIEARPDAIYIISSRYAFALLAATGDRRIYGARYLCVGEATREFAKGLGFAHTECGGENAKHILRAAMSCPQDMSFAYLSASRPRLPIDALLRHEGRDARAIALYDTAAQTRISRPGAFFLTHGHIAGIALYSVEMAETWIKITAEFNEYVKKIPHICISPAVAQRVIDLRGDCFILTASSPTADATERLAATAINIRPS